MTEAQLRCLKTLVAFMILNGKAPTRLELGAILGVAGPSVHQMLDRLEDHGAIKRDPHQRRNVQPTQRGLALTLGAVL